jgi:hypothetical protein
MTLGVKETQLEAKYLNGLALLSAVGTLSILIWLLKYSHYGFDFTDESFYLVWISNPFLYDFSITQFGFIYHPLYLLLNGDIAALRQANILITFGLAWGLVYAFLRSLLPNTTEPSLAVQGAAAGLATSVFTLFVNWLPTPSYNSLTLQALLITGIGVLLADKNCTCKSVTGWIVIGSGGWLAFMAKPSTAIGLATGVLFYLLVSRKFSIRLLMLAVTSALVPLLVSALLIDGSVFRFVIRLQQGVEFSRYLDGGYKLNKLFRIDGFKLNTTDSLAFILVLTVSLVATWGAFSDTKKGVIVSISASVALYILIALLVFDQIRNPPGLGQFKGILIFGVVSAAVLMGFFLGRLRVLKDISIAQWVLAVFFLVMPHIYAFGTNNNYWQTGSAASIFWVLSGITFLGSIVRARASRLFLLPLVLPTQAVTAILLQTGLEKPYRQPQPLRLNETKLEIGPQKSNLILSYNYASYVSSAATTALNAGYKAATPVIDLSGQSPGILYALGAENIGLAWILGGYPGSLNYAKAAFGIVPCEKIAIAWVLHEPNGPLRIPTDLMGSLGSIFPEGYKLVGTWQTAEGAGGLAASRTQALYKPIASNETLGACKALREKRVQ